MSHCNSFQKRRQPSAKFLLYKQTLVIKFLAIFMVPLQNFLVTPLWPPTKNSWRRHWQWLIIHKAHKALFRAITSNMALANQHLNLLKAWQNYQSFYCHRRRRPAWAIEWPPGREILSFWPLKWPKIRVEPPPPGNWKMAGEPFPGALPWKNSCLRPWYVRTYACSST